MNHCIKLNIPANADNESLFSSIESTFNQSNFKVERKDDYLIFERLTPQNISKLQLIVELIGGFTKGKITIDNHVPATLTCKIVYYKQLVVSLILGLVLTFIFSMYTENFWALFLKLGIPASLLFLVIGILSGNDQVEDLLKKALNGKVLNKK